VITKSIRLALEESRVLRRISQAQGVSEATLMRKFVLEGLARCRLEEAIQAYSRGEIDLSTAARHARVSVYQMLSEIQRRDITPPTTQDKFLNGLETLARTFGGSEALLHVITETRQQAVDS